MGIDTGLDTITSAVTAVGQDMDDWLKVHAAELQKMRELGIPAYRSNYAAPIEGQSTPIVIDNKGE
jgi:capsid protein